MNLYENARGAEGFEQRNAADVKIGCKRIVEKICWAKKNVFRIDCHLSQRG